MIVLSPAPKSNRYWNFGENAAAQLSETCTDERTFLGRKRVRRVWVCIGAAGAANPLLFFTDNFSLFFTNFFFGRDWEGKEDATRRGNCVTFFSLPPSPDATMVVFICRGFYFFEKLSAHDTTALAISGLGCVYIVQQIKCRDYLMGVGCAAFSRPLSKMIFTLGLIDKRPSAHRHNR